MVCAAIAPTAFARHSCAESSALSESAVVASENAASGNLTSLLVGSDSDTDAIRITDSSVEQVAAAVSLTTLQPMVCAATAPTQCQFVAHSYAERNAGQRRPLIQTGERHARRTSRHASRFLTIRSAGRCGVQSPFSISLRRPVAGDSASMRHSHAGRANGQMSLATDKANSKKSTGLARKAHLGGRLTRSDSNSTTKQQQARRGGTAGVQQDSA